MSKGNCLLLLPLVFWVIFLGGCQDQSETPDSAAPTRDLPVPGISASVENPPVEDPPVPSPAPADVWRNFLWREDINAFSMGYKAKHVDLFYWRDEEFFDRQVEELQEHAAELTDLEIVLELKKIINSMQDSHSTVYFDDAVYCDEFFPFQFRLMEDGLYIVNVYTGDFPDYQDALYGKVAAVNGIAEARIRDSVFPFLCGDRYETGRRALYAGQFLPAYLYGAGIADRDEGFVFTLTWEDGTVYEQKVETISGAVRRNARLAVEYPMFFAANTSENCYTYVPEEKALYFAYNICYDDGSLRQKFEEMRKILIEEDVEKVVVDLRNNGGGNAALLEPFMSMLTVLRAQYKDLYVVTGNGTLGAGTVNAKALSELDGAVLIGEPTGDAPYGMSGQAEFQLPNSALRCIYTTRINTPDLGRTHLGFEESTLEPDIRIANTVDNYKQQTDAVWEYAAHIG